eukprot:s5834_g1.t1
MDSIGAFVQMLKPAQIKPKAKADNAKMMSPKDCLKPKAKCEKVDGPEGVKPADDDDGVNKDGPADAMVDARDDDEESFGVESEKEQEQEAANKDHDDPGEEPANTEEDVAIPSGSKGEGLHDDHALEGAHQEGEEEEPADDDQEDEEIDEEEEEEIDPDETPGLKGIHKDEHEEDESERQKLKEFLDAQNKRKVDHGWNSHGKWHHRNKGYKGKSGHKGYKKGNHKGHHKGWNDWRWNQQGKGYQKWGKWQDWDWDYGSHSQHHGDRLLIPDKKGQGYYLPGQQGFLDNNGVLHPPGEGLKGKSRVRGGVKAQICKRKAAQEAEELETRKHNRMMMDKLASLAEKALDKM